MTSLRKLLNRLDRGFRHAAGIVAEAFNIRPRSAGTQLDATDIILFETLQWIATQESVAPLWDEPATGREYQVIATPTYFVRRDESGTAEWAYLLNFPIPPGGADPVSHPSTAGLGAVHRYDDQMSDLSQAIDFDFDLEIDGRPTFAMTYAAKQMDRTPLTNTSLPITRLDDWVRVFVHELFHHFQYHAPDSTWLKLAWGDGLSTADYPVTGQNIALSLLERRALLAGREATTTITKAETLRRVLAIRLARTRLPEAVKEKCEISHAVRTHGQRVTSPDGIGQSFIAGQDGLVRSLRVDVHALDDPNATLHFQTGTNSWPGNHRQQVELEPGENVIWLDTPYPVQTGATYSFALFPTTGDLSVWSSRDASTSGEAFFISGSARLGITPSPDLVFALTIAGPNYIDRMDRYQERNEGSATFVARRLFVRSENAVQAQEMLEMLERGMATDQQTSHADFMNTTFKGGWYDTGSTIMDLVDVVTTVDWRSTYPAGGNPIAALEDLYGPPSQLDVTQLVDDAKQAYDWPSIEAQVAAIPSDYLDPC